MNTKIRGVRDSACKLCDCQEFLSNPWKEEKCLNCYHYHKPGSLIAQQKYQEANSRFHGSIGKGGLQRLLESNSNSTSPPTLLSSSPSATTSNPFSSTSPQKLRHISPLSEKSASASTLSQNGPTKVSKTAIGTRTQRPRGGHVSRMMDSFEDPRGSLPEGASALHHAPPEPRGSMPDRPPNFQKTGLKPALPAKPKTISGQRPNLNRPQGGSSTSSLPLTSSAFSSSSPSLVSEKKVDPNLKTNKLKELYETERTYMNSLQTLVHGFCAPLKRDPRGAKKERVVEIFSNIEQVLEFNTKLMESFEERLSTNINPDTTCIGDIFLSLGLYLKPYYSVYCDSYANAQSALKECEKSKDFLAFVETVVDSELCRGESLRSFLIKPIQRIPRYQLLLEELNQNTPTNHPDKKNLAEATDKIKGIANDVNEAIRRGENTIKTLAIQNSFISAPSLVAPHRIFIKDGCMLKTCRKEKKPRWFFLFSDILVYASFLESGAFLATKYVLRGNFPLSSLKVEDLGDTPEQTNSFQIISASKSFAVSCTSKEEKIDWLLAFNECMGAEKKRRETFAKQGVKHQEMNFTAPVWHPDTPDCQICKRQFTTFFRRHHCRVCGLCVCDKCSRAKVALVNYGKDPVRVCDKCWKELNG